ncbi:hypothetical protein C8J56DRAFT_935363 [Mycena floridula]|nr:hypothetical protein C8J56DRAFT_935363 [Mycena floridula]
MSSKDFSSVPILDFSWTHDAALRPKFIAQLQNALINVGFFYLKSAADQKSKVDRLVSYIPRFFSLPPEEKERIKMSNSPHFLGYSNNSEFTKGKLDIREQIDIATPMECRWKQDGDRDYLRLWGPSQWPQEDLIPGFKDATEQYLFEIQTLADSFVPLIAEALGLSPDGLAHFYATPEKMQHRCKLVQYPAATDDSSNQGVGPHYDAGFVTILLQASSHKGLQVQNLAGDWIDVEPIPGTFVINIGRALEFATQGIARATSHRVLSPPVGSTTPRYSVPFFHNISLDVKVGDKEHTLTFPPEILKLRDERGSVAATDSVNFTEFGSETSGKVNLIGRIKSHPDVAIRHYPDLFRTVFPAGLPVIASSY